MLPLIRKRTQATALTERILMSMFRSASQMQFIEFTAEIWLPRSPDEVFPFFGNARNLQTITPDWLNFEVLTPEPIPMRTGVMIDYRLRLRGIPLRWTSEITAWDPPHRFVDEQRRGPYRAWIHEHRFVPKDGGTQAIDHVRYSVWGGKLIDVLLVRRDVKKIFEFRRTKLLEMFGNRQKV